MNSNWSKLHSNKNERVLSFVTLLESFATARRVIFKGSFISIRLVMLYKV